MKLGFWLFACVSSLALSACGGSASETPWPVEPENIDLGPAGETKRADDLIKKPESSAEAASAPDEREPGKAGSKKLKKVDPVSP